MFATTAHAQETSAELEAPSPLAGLLPVVVMIALFYFLLIRPQQKKIAAHKAMIQGLNRGDKVLTAGGIHGTISKVEDDILQVEIAKDTIIKVAKDTISYVVNSSKPSDSAPAKDSKASKKDKE